MVTGNETPLIVGVQRDLTCTAPDIDVARIEWKLVIPFLPGLETVVLGANNVDELTLELTPSNTVPQLLKCVVVGTDGEHCSVDVPITIQGSS